MKLLNGMAGLRTSDRTGLGSNSNSLVNQAPPLPQLSVPMRELEIVTAPGLAEFMRLWHVKCLTQGLAPRKVLVDVNCDD